jgi:glutamate-5-semialdehyde dehydrogenase
MKLLSTEQKNKVLQSMVHLLDQERTSIIAANKKDLELFNKQDRAMYDRLIVDDQKVDGMIRSIKEVMLQDDPVAMIKSERILENGLKVQNRSAPFGTIMIIYESRPDVTIEAAVLAFKANNKILLKGGKEAVNSNRALEACWHKALTGNGLDPQWIQLLHLNREQTQEFLRNPPEKLDLIVPRGGERLIAFVKEHAQCAVLISGRGNNFLYMAKDANWDQGLQVILNAKTQKISACNALDKILMDRHVEGFDDKVRELGKVLETNGVSVLIEKPLQEILPQAEVIVDEAIWYQEFLAMKCCIGAVDGMEMAIQKINRYSGGHSATIMTKNADTALMFMDQVDSAAVYHNASTRFTDGGAMGVGAELAISTDKLHHRGPLGLEQLVTNKYYVFGNGHIRN